MTDKLEVDDSLVIELKNVRFISLEGTKFYGTMPNAFGIGIDHALAKELRAKGWTVRGDPEDTLSYPWMPVTMINRAEINAKHGSLVDVVILGYPWRIKDKFGIKAHAREVTPSNT